MRVRPGLGGYDGTGTLNDLWGHGLGHPELLQQYDLSSICFDGVSVQYRIRGTTIIHSMYSPSSGPYEELLEVAFAIGGERMPVMYHY
jgi:hypothetical protein